MSTNILLVKCQHQFMLDFEESSLDMKTVRESMYIEEKNRHAMQDQVNRVGNLSFTLEGVLKKSHGISYENLNRFLNVLRIEQIHANGCSAPQCTDCTQKRLNIGLHYIAKTKGKGLFLEFRHRSYFGRFLPLKNMEDAKENLKKSKECMDQLMSQSEDKKKEFLQWAKLTPEQYDRMMKIENLNLVDAYTKYYGKMENFKKYATNGLILLKNLAKHNFVEEFYMHFAMSCWDVAKYLYEVVRNFKQSAYCLNAGLIVLEKYATNGYFTQQDIDVAKSSLKFRYVVHCIELLKNPNVTPVTTLMEFPGIPPIPEIPPKHYEVLKSYDEAKAMLALATKIFKEARKYPHWDENALSFTGFKLNHGKTCLEIGFGGMDMKDFAEMQNKRLFEQFNGPKKDDDSDNDDDKGVFMMPYTFK